MVKVKLQPHPNSIKVKQIYLHIILVIAIAVLLIFTSLFIVFLLLIAGLILIYILIERFVKKLTHKKYDTEINDGYLIYNGERIPIKQIKTASNPIEKRFGLLKFKVKNYWIKWIHIDDWKRYFEN